MPSKVQRPLQFDRLTSADYWCAAYQQRGLPAKVDRAGLVLMLTGSVAAVHIPADLGARVQNWLRQLMVAGPVLGLCARRRPERWTFLCQPNVTPRVDTAAALTAAGAVQVPEGTPLRLPTSMKPQPPGMPWWVQLPEIGRELPLLSAVICAARVHARERGATA